MCGILGKRMMYMLNRNKVTQKHTIISLLNSTKYEFFKTFIFKKPQVFLQHNSFMCSLATCVCLVVFVLWFFSLGGGGSISSSTFFEKVIKEDGGIPGFEALADVIFMFSDSSDSCARFKAAIVSSVAEEPCTDVVLVIIWHDHLIMAVHMHK